MGMHARAGQRQIVGSAVESGFMLQFVEDQRNLPLHMISLSASMVYIRHVIQLACGNQRSGF